METVMGGPVAVLLLQKIFTLKPIAWIEKMLI
jgi:hypothetical protein